MSFACKCHRARIFRSDIWNSRCSAYMCYKRRAAWLPKHLLTHRGVKQRWRTVCSTLSHDWATVTEPDSRFRARQHIQKPYLGRIK